MFHKKKKKVDLVFWIFGVIVLGIVISVAVLSVSLFSQEEKPILQTTDDLIQDIPRPSFTSEELMLQYDDTMEALFADVAQDTDTSIDDLLNSIEERLLDMRVPREMQQLHLQAVLSVSELRVQLAQDDKKITRITLRSIFDPFDFLLWD